MVWSFIHLYLIQILFIIMILLDYTEDIVIAISIALLAKLI